MSGEGRQHACVNFLPAHTSAVICFRVVERKCDFGLLGVCRYAYCSNRWRENRPKLYEVSAVHCMHASLIINHCKIASLTMSAVSSESICSSFSRYESPSRLSKCASALFRNEHLDPKANVFGRFVRRVCLRNVAFARRSLGKRFAFSRGLSLAIRGTPARNQNLSGDFMASFIGQLKQVFRRLSRAPLFAAVILITATILCRTT